MCKLSTLSTALPLQTQEQLNVLIFYIRHDHLGIKVCHPYMTHIRINKLEIIFNISNNLAKEKESMIKTKIPIISCKISCKNLYFLIISCEFSYQISLKGPKS